MSKKSGPTIKGWHSGSSKGDAGGVGDVSSEPDPLDKRAPPVDPLSETLPPPEDDSLVRALAHAPEVPLADPSLDPASDMAELQPVAEELYVLGTEIGHGGMGRIVAARDRRLGRRVAIKQLLVENDDLRRRFRREALVTARLQHPAIVPVYEAGRSSSGEPFYAMKMVDGEPLEKVIARATTIPERLALLSNVLSVVEALAYAHSQRVIHRDLKPANILVGAFGETVVIDWGLAKHLDDGSATTAADSTVAVTGGLTLAGSVMGTPSYMPPEQAKGAEVDERTDVYSLGAILYHLLCGERPYTGPTSNAILAEVMSGPPVSLRARQPDVPAPLATIVEKAMARDASLRYHSAAELAADLRAFQTGRLVGAHEYSARDLLLRWMRLHRGALAVGGAAMAVLLGLAAFSVVRISRERTRAEAGRLTARAEQVIEEDPAAAARQLRAAHQMSPSAEDERVARAWWARGAERFIPTGYGMSVSCSQDGRTCAFAAGESTVRIWETDFWRPTATIELGDMAVTEVALAPDGARLAIADVMGDVVLWAREGSGWAQRWKQDALPRVVWSLKWSPEGDWIAAGTVDAGKILSSTTGETTRSWEGAAQKLAVGSDGSIAAVEQNQVLTFNVRRSGQHVYSLPTNASAVEIAGDGVLVGLVDGRVLSMTHSGFEVVHTGTGSPIMAIRELKDHFLVADATGRLEEIDRDFRVASTLRIGGGNLVTEIAAAPGAGWLALAEPSRGIRVVRLSRTPAQLVPAVRGVEIHSLAYSPVRDLVAVGSAQGQIMITAPGRGSILCGSPGCTGEECSAHADSVMVLAWSSDGTLLASSSLGWYVLVWDVRAESCTMRAELALDVGPLGPEGTLPVSSQVGALSFAADGSELAIAQVQGGAWLWKTNSSSTSPTRAAGDLSQVNVLGWDPQRGHRLVGYSSNLSAFVVGDPGGEVARIPAPAEWKGVHAQRLAWQPGGRLVVLGNAGGRVVALDVETRRIAWQAWNPGGPATDLSWAPDGEALAVAWANGSIAVLDPLGGEVRARDRSGLLTNDSLAWIGRNKLLVGGLGTTSLIEIDHPEADSVWAAIDAQLSWSDSLGVGGAR